MSSKKSGGLGIKRITEWNKIAILKHIWNLCNDLDGSIWSTWIRSNLLRGRNSGQSRRQRIALGLGERF